MKKIAIGRQQSESAYLNTAPEALIRFHKDTGIGKEILGRLLTDTRMDKGWTILSSHINAQDERRYIKHSPHNPYRRLWSEIGTILLTSRRPEKTFADLDCDLEKIERHATKLRDAIIDPARTGQSRPRTVPRKTGARFDYLPLYEYFPAEVMKLNMQDIPLPDNAWEQANDMGRGDIAHRLLSIWPTLSELLNELLAKINQERKKEKRRERPVKRDRKLGDNASNKEMRFFVVRLAQYLEQEFKMHRKIESIPVTAAIAAAVFKQKVPSNFVRAALRGK